MKPHYYLCIGLMIGMFLGAVVHELDMYNNAMKNHHWWGWVTK